MTSEERDTQMSKHAIDNAKAWFQSIREMVATLEAISEHADYGASRELDQQYEDVDQELQESPLSVRVRSGWYEPGSQPGAPVEYETLLSTGGPALRIVGEHSEHGEPTSATLQWQDWGTPWTPLHMSELPCAASEADATLLRYASHFYFGE